MIGRISGSLLHKQGTEILVDVGGVGYELQVPVTTLVVLPAVGQAVTLVTHHAVREDAHTLYGFVTERDRELFRHLIRVSGVGPKLALTILSGMDSNSFARAVHGGDLTALVALPGVGKKTAERLLVEMRDRLASWLHELRDAADSGAVRQPAASDRVAEAEEALVSLGYKPAEAARLIAAVDDDDSSSEELIRRALKSTLRG